MKPKNSNYPAGLYVSEAEERLIKMAKVLLIIFTASLTGFFMIRM